MLSQAFAYDRRHPSDAKYVENVMWMQSRVLVVTLNIPGGSNNDQDGSSAITFTPVASTTGQLLGAWTGAARMQVLVYNADGTAFYATPFDVQNPTGGAQGAGLDDVCLVGVVPTASTGSYTPDFTASYPGHSVHCLR